MQDSFVQAQRLADGGMVETYLARTKPDESYSDTTKLYYSPLLNKLPESFSPERDAAHKAKLYKVEAIYSGGFSKQYNEVLPARTLLFELLPLAKINEAELKRLQTIYEREMANAPMGND